ncbi:MAG: undecaprenyldiphospho-muramoylpentapeptide beta-N-acetylglucosaminyltransferase [Oscillospiraceae bacterium]|nr:undecaprenyldiphospho-muramoylpentapeptide beta-N-acetylglucosaminyltransferase [Oscillospiraceae bacterium]
MRFMFACGGTGGHINPALAVAKLVKEKKKSAEILFVGVSGGMEERLVPAAGFDIKTIESKPISRKKGISGIVANIDAIKHIFSAERAAKKIIEEFSPDVVMGTGGYACYPVLSAAARLGIPSVVHESNAYPGMATRKLAKRVTRVLLNFEASRKKLPERASCAVVGNPVRGDILMYDRETARRELGVTKPLLVSFWGSLGAREMNKAIAQVIRIESENPGGFFHIHATGKFGYEWMPDAIREMGIDLQNQSFITLREYIDDMPRVLAAADVVMCRGGAGTLSEVSARGVPAIIVPSPNVTDNHQFKNASELAASGGAVVIEEKNATPQMLYDTAKELLENAEKRSGMSENLLKNAILDGTERIYEEMMHIIAK